MSYSGRVTRRTLLHPVSCAFNYEMPDGMSCCGCTVINKLRVSECQQTTQTHRQVDLISLTRNQPVRPEVETGIKFD